MREKCLGGVVVLRIKLRERNRRGKKGHKEKEVEEKNIKTSIFNIHLLLFLISISKPYNYELRLWDDVSIRTRS